MAKECVRRDASVSFIRLEKGTSSRVPFLLLLPQGDQLCLALTQPKQHPSLPLMREVKGRDVTPPK